MKLTGPPGLGVPAPSGLTPPHLVVRLHPDWRYDEASSRLLGGEDAEEFEPQDLPEGSEIVYMIPDLQTIRKQLCEAEAELACYLHVLLPPGSDPEEILSRVANWPGVEEVRMPPEISLPEP